MRNDILEQAKAIRAAMGKVTATLTDEQALEVKELYPLWVNDTAYSVDTIVRYEDKLYRCVQAHTSQADWTPPSVPALWAVINRVNAGTLDDPIAAERGMEYEYGLYYLDPDPEYGGVYLCKREGEAAGGTVVLHFLPHELTGNYFTLVE